MEQKYYWDVIFTNGDTKSMYGTEAEAEEYSEAPNVAKIKINGTFNKTVSRVNAEK